MELLKIFIDQNASLQISVSSYLVFTILVLILLLVIFNSILKKGNDVYEVDEAELGIGNQKVKVRPNYEDIQIAYKLWVELSTRKLGLPLDFEHDVIIDVYNSWHEFFKVTRELLKEVPVRKIKNNENTMKIVNLAIDVLNDAIRPHLTKWQARFRRWYSNEIDNYKDVSPQDIQKKFPAYDELVEDMKHVNSKLIYYRRKLKEISVK